VDVLLFTLFSEELINLLSNLVEMLVLPISKGKHREPEVAQPFTPLIPLKSNDTKRLRIHKRRRKKETHTQTPKRITEH
jgi:hypothetical protein